MHRVDGPGFAPGNLFTEGDPLVPTPPTVVTDDWLNAVQEEICNVIEGVGGVLDKPVDTQLATAIHRIAALSSRGNALLNGSFRIWQEAGTTPGAVVDDVLSYDGPDGWLFDGGGAGAVASISRQKVAVLSLVPPSGALTVLRINKTTAGAAGDFVLAQRVEDVATFQGRNVVVAFDAQKQGASNDVALVGVDIVQRFGAGGSPSADVTTALTITPGATIDGQFRRFVATGTLPTIVGKTIGTANDNVEVRIKLAGAITFDVYLTAAVFGIGVADPGFAERDFATELGLCRRYFEKSHPIDSPVTAASAASCVGAIWDTGLTSGATVETLRQTYRVPKYGTSARVLTWYALNGTADAITRASATAEAVSSITAQDAEESVLPPTMTSPPAGGTFHQYRANWAVACRIP